MPGAFSIVAAMTEKTGITEEKRRIAQNAEIIPFGPKHIDQVKAFTDRWIGEGYFEPEELKECLGLAELNGLNCSLLAYVGGELAGVRLTFAPGAWLESARGASRQKWQVLAEQVGYFKSLFVAEKFQQGGLGRKLSETSISVLKQMGARAAVCHSWMESPGNSSQRYLKNLGFEEVAVHSRFWHEIDYMCTRCAPRRCECAAAEMIKYF